MAAQDTRHASVEPSTSATTLDEALPAVEEAEYRLSFSYRGEKLPVSVKASDTIGDLKAILYSLSAVPPARQKLVGLVPGRLPGDEVAVETLGLKPDAVKSAMLVGTPDGQELQPDVGSKAGDLAPIDVDVDYASSIAQAIAASHNTRNQRKLREAAANLQINLMAQPRPGKKLLVLDLDHCIFDTKLWKEQNFAPEMYLRPYLHEMLQQVAPFYDIVIWSQTSWRWLETKLIQLSIIGDERRGDYHVICVLDREPMFAVYGEKNGQVIKHEVKALGIIWSKLSEHYNPSNTVHVDDLARNFALNPENGIKIKAFHDAMGEGQDDRELVYMTKYLLQLALVEDVTKFEHKKFKKCKLPLPEGVTDPVAAHPDNLKRY